MLSYPISKSLLNYVDSSENSCQYYFQEWNLSSKLQSFMNQEKPKGCLFDCLKYIICYSHNEKLYKKDTDSIVPDDDLYCLLKCKPFESLTCSRIEKYLCKHFNSLKKSFSKNIKKIEKFLDPNEELFFTRNSTKITVRKNIYGNWEHPATNLVFDRFSREVCGKQGTGVILPLTEEDIDLCNKYKFKVSRVSLYYYEVFKNSKRSSYYVSGKESEEAYIKTLDSKIDSYIDKNLELGLQLGEEFNKGQFISSPLQEKMEQHNMINEEQKEEVVEESMGVKKEKLLQYITEKHEGIPVYGDTDSVMFFLPPHITNNKEQKESIDDILKENSENLKPIESLEIEQIVKDLVDSSINKAIEDLNIEKLSNSSFIDNLENIYFPHTNDHVIDIFEESPEVIPDLSIVDSEEKECTSEDDWVYVQSVI